ncbi:hypothetical protein BGZ80_010647 [Entomortierella chlamydospora]|uniref:PH domain-containing protein n=1 Tax=Entomortierella chlamydospora TaxID=101097 RepID=A0A9P6MV96_9FUNG|nr:hypothetical protein BGZ80_010647 [Entomortierella chlamydospora]
MVAKAIKFFTAGLEAAMVDTKPIGVLHLADYSILSHGPDVSRKSKYSFRLSSADDVDHLFHTETPQALDLWIDAIQSHINHALSNLEVLGPLDLDPNGDRPGFDRTSSSNNCPCQRNGEQSIIDKVLDRLQLDDPTLSDMNDPSTLIMPAQEHPPFQHPTQKSFRELQLSLDDNLDGWFPSPSAVLYSSSDANASANTSMSVDVHHSSKPSIDTSSSQRSPIVIRRTNHGTFNGSESFSQSSGSSHTDPYSSYSSYSEFGSGNKSVRGSVQSVDYQGRPSLQQGRGSHGLHSNPSSLSFVQHYHPQLSSPSLHSHRPKGQVSPVEPGVMSHYEGAADFSLPSPTLAASSLIDSSCPYLKHTESKGSANSVSTLDLAMGDSTGSYSTITEKGLMITPSDSNQKNGKDSGSCCKKSNRSKNYCTDGDLSPIEVIDKEAKAAVSNDGKKSKKLWQVTSGDKASGSGSNESIRRSTSQSLDSNSLMLKNLVLVSLPIKKHSNSHSNSHTTTTAKGFSKSMVSLNRGSELDTRPSLGSPSSASPLEHRNHGLFSSERPTHRTRSPSVSVLEEAFQSGSHEYSQFIQKQTLMHGPIDGNILYSRSPLAPSHSQHPKAVTSPISLITGDWNPISRGKRNITQPVRCVDPELHLHKPSPPPIKPNEDVSRHIVAPDELAMAMLVDQEAEGRRQQQESESIDQAAAPESEPSPSPTLTAVIEPTSSLDDDTISLTNEDISLKLGSSCSSDSTERPTTAAWSLPPPKRPNYYMGQEAAAAAGITVNTRDYPQQDPTAATRESPTSPISPVLPPILPRRSPFRSAPIPSINSA